MASVNEKFARTVFRNGAVPWATCFKTYPPPGEEGRSSWRGFPIAGEWPPALDDPKANCFISNGSIRDPTKTNTDDNFHALHAIVCDDVGVKVDASKLNRTPSAIIRTSSSDRGASHQYWYFLREPIRDIALAKQVVKAMIAAELTDAGAGRVIQYYRLPVGTNSKPEYEEPFQQELIWFQPDELHNLEDLIDSFGLTLEAAKPSERPALDSGTSTLSDDALLARARKAVSGPAFCKLYDDGDVSDYQKGNSTGLSEATLGLLNRLAFWSNRDAAQMDRLFRGSALMRDKWDSRRGTETWGAQQIAKAIAGTEETWQELQERPTMEFTQPGTPHPLLQFSDYVSPHLEAPEFIIDGLIQAGIVMIAGASGVGKTTCLVPLFAAAAHLCPADFPFKPRIKRRVLYVAEDVGQAKRVIYSLRHFGGAPGTDAEWQDMFRLVQAQRMSAAKIVEIADACLEMATENVSTETGAIYQAPPVIVLDTANATINLDNENDNAEVGKAIALLKHRFARIPLAIVAHTTKANKRADAAELSARGAGAWEADAQQSLVLFMDEADENTRYMMLGKKRFETATKEVKFSSSSHSVVAANVLGEAVEITVRHSVATSCAAGEREQARADAKERARSVERFSRLQKAVSLVAQANKAGEIITKDRLAGQIGGRKSDALAEIAGLIEGGELAEVPVPAALRGNNRVQFHLVTREVETARKYREERGQ